MTLKTFLVVVMAYDSMSNAGTLVHFNRKRFHMLLFKDPMCHNIEQPYNK